MTTAEASASPPPAPRPFYLRWWFILIVVLAVLAAIGSLLPRTGSTSAPTTDPSATSTPSALSPPSAVAVTAHVLAGLGQPTLQQACEKDGVAWACNVVSIKPLDDSELRVTVTALADGEAGAVVALEFRTRISAEPGSPMPDLQHVIVVDPAGNELGAAE